MAAPISVLLTGDTSGLQTAMKQAESTVSTSTMAMLAGIKQVGAGMAQTQQAAAGSAQAVSESATAFDKAGNAAKQYAAAQTLIYTEINQVRAAQRAGTIDSQAAAAQVLLLNSALRAQGAEYRNATAAITGGATAVVGAHGRMGASSMIMMHSVRSVSDSFAAGLPPMMIFSEQLARLGEAAALSGGGAGALGKVGAFMAGPWGIAVLGAVAVIGTIISKMDLFGDSADKAGDKIKKQAADTEAARIAQMAFDNTIDGSIIRERKLNDELEKRIKNQAQLNAQQTGKVAAGLGTDQSNQTTARDEITRTQRLRDEARAALSSPAAGLPGAMAGFQIAFQTAEQKFAKAQADLIKANATVLEGERNLRAARAIELQDQAKGIADPKLGARQALEAQQGALTDKFYSGGLGETSYKAQFADLQRKIDALGHSTGEASAALGNMVALIKQLFPGARITSTTDHSRMTADGHVSDHVLGRAIDFVPGGGMGQFSSAEVEQMLKDAGVKIRRGSAGNEQFFGPGMGPHGANDHSHDNHFHVAFEGNPSPESADRAIEAAKRRAQEVADKATRRAVEFSNTSEGLDKAILEAKKAGINDDAKLDALAKQEIVVEADKFSQQLVGKVQLGDLTKAQALELGIKNAVVAVLKQQKIDIEAQSRAIKDAADKQLAANDNAASLLHLQENLAVTSEERRKLALQILDIEKEQLRIKAQEMQDLYKIGKATKEDADKAQGAYNEAVVEDPSRRQGVINSTRSPLDQYLADNDPKLIGEKVQRAYVDELEAVKHGIDDAITNALGINDPFLKSIIDLFIQQVLINPIAKALSGASGGGGGLLGGLLGGGGGLLGGLFGGGGNSLASNGFGPTLLGAGPVGINPGGAEFITGAFASGTDSAPGGLSWVGEKGPELVNVPKGAQIFPSNVSAMMAKNDNSPNVEAHFHYHGQMSERERRETTQQAMRDLRREMGRSVRLGG